MQQAKMAKGRPLPQSGVMLTVWALTHVYAQTDTHKRVEQKCQWSSD